MPDPAPTQVKKAFQQRFIDNGAARTFIDRDDSEPIQPEERPCRVVRIGDIIMNERLESVGQVVLWSAQVFIDHYADVDVTDDLPNDLAVMASDTNGWIVGDGTGWTMGGLLFELTPVSLIVNADDVPDTGVAVFELEAKFLTRQNDWTQIVF